MTTSVNITLTLIFVLGCSSVGCDTFDKATTKDTEVSPSTEKSNTVERDPLAQSPVRTPIELVVLFDLSGSQTGERELNREILVALADKLFVRDLFRVIPIDQSSEGHNEMLIDEMMPAESGLMDMDLVAARNRAIESSENIDTIALRRLGFTNSTSIIGALNTPAVLEPRSGHRRLLVLVTDGEEASWEVSLYSDFDPSQVVDTLKQEARIPDLSDREVFVVGPSSARVHERQLRKIRQFWELFFQEAGCRSFEWLGWDRRLVVSHVNRIQVEGQPQEQW